MIRSVNHVDVEVMGTLACLSNAGVRRLTGADNQAALEMLASTGVHIVDNLVNLEQVLAPVIIHQLRERFYAGRPVPKCLKDAFEMAAADVVDRDIYFRTAPWKPHRLRR